ncbi:DUF4113 domain-containing protein [Sphingobacterium nematocida]|uniref:DUF4113 domain-containing protein n=1 Tax=Sphingobacterium nematocida TaxID=1513896 RepID=UPI001116B6D8|nr:DUF4113 domain-containing protein [Sphingobacterium nematocida]
MSINFCIFLLLPMLAVVSLTPVFARPRYKLFYYVELDIHLGSQIHINKQYGHNTVRLGAQGKRMWRMQQERLSPRYWTDIRDIINIQL